MIFNTKEEYRRKQNAKTLLKHKQYAKFFRQLAEDIENGKICMLIFTVAYQSIKPFLKTTQIRSGVDKSELWPQRFDDLANIMHEHIKEYLYQGQDLTQDSQASDEAEPNDQTVH